MISTVSRALLCSAPPPASQPFAAKRCRVRLAGFAADSVADISASLLMRAGNGAFITNCLEHNVADMATGDPAGPGFARFGAYELAGVKTAAAILEWWNAPSDAPVSAHTHISSCILSTDAPYECNPSCHASQSMPAYAQFESIAPMRSACNSTCTCEPNQSK